MKHARIRVIGSITRVIFVPLGYIFALSVASFTVGRGKAASDAVRYASDLRAVLEAKRR